MTDTSPLIKLKSALSSLRSEIRSMDVSLGFASAQVMHTKVYHKMRGGAVGDAEEEDDA